jgi:hypothetical protein
MDRHATYLDTYSASPLESPEVEGPVSPPLPARPTVERKTKGKGVPVWDRETKWLGAEGVAAKENAAIARRAGLKSLPRSLEGLLELPEWKGSTVELEEPTYTLLPLPTTRVRIEGSKSTDGFVAPCFGPRNASVKRYAVLTHPSGATMRIDVLALEKQ